MPYPISMNDKVIVGGAGLVLRPRAGTTIVVDGGRAL
jgi:hypothetical protein